MYITGKSPCNLRMPLKVVVSFSKLFDGVILPISMHADKGVVGYDLVVRQNATDLVKVPFTSESPPISLLLFKRDEVVPSRFIMHSNKPVVARLNEGEVCIYVYKIMFNGNDTVGYIRLIGDHSATQDKPILSFSTQFENQRWVSIEDIPSEGGRYKPVTSIGIRKGVMTSPKWFTQGGFYGSSHVSSNNAIQMLDLEDIFVKYRKRCARNTKSLVDLVVEFGEIVKEGLIYKEDYTFSSPSNPDDAGDSQLEISKFGDCEDFAHFYMRTIRLMMWTYGLVFTENSPMYKLWEEFARNYIPMVYIGKVKIKGQVDYHSTMLLIPVDGTHPTISFEVTNPKRSIVLDSVERVEEFYKWHIESYFLVDNYFLYQIDSPIEKITGELLSSKCINY